jgi:hypothetical protein
MHFKCVVAGLLYFVVMATQTDSLAVDQKERERVEVGWQDDFRTDRGWILDSGKPPGRASVEFGPGGATFTVSACDCPITWTRTTNPIWPDPFGFLEVLYNIEQPDDASASISLLLTDDSTGPVTPGALNPENPLAGDHEALLGPLPHDRNRAIFNLRRLFPSDRISRITLQITPGDAPVKVDFRRLTFWSSDPSEPSQLEARLSATPMLAGEASASSPPPSRPVGWLPVDMPDRDRISATWLAAALGTSPDWPTDKEVERGGIRFRLGSVERAAACTGVMETDTLEITGGWRGCELALLLATRMFGSDVRAFGSKTGKPRAVICSPHRLAVRLEYEDGATMTCFPWSVRHGEWIVRRLPDTYIVPLDAQKTLRRITVADRMNFGQVFLLAASVNSSMTPAFPNARPPAAIRLTRQVPVPAVSPTQVKREVDRLTVENAWLRLAAEMRTGPRLERLRLVPFDREILNTESPATMVEVLAENGEAVPMQLEAGKADSVAGGVAMEFRWSLAESGHGIFLHTSVTDRGSIRLTATLHNQAGQPWKTDLRYPRIQECRVSDVAGDSWYLLGTVNSALSRVPLSVRTEHGTRWPLPLADLFAKRAGGGLGMFVDGPDVLPKTLEFNQSESATDMAIRFHDLVVPPHQRLKLPPVVLMVHLGDWHDLFNEYRARVHGRTPPGARKRLQDAFYCRRDYPLGGTGHLFDPLTLRYAPQRLAAESSRAFGGIDMIDISGWAYSLATGRVGDYLSNDLGGLSVLGRMVEQSHADGIKVGLYFEGYLIDRRSVIARKAIPDWQFIDKSGKPRWWAGKMEFFACPGVEEWRKELAGMVAKVTQETGADAVYVDQFGLLGPGRACWSPNHGHPVPSHPIREERAMLQAIREALDERTANVAIYIEYTPPDSMMDLVDAAFDYGMADITPPGRHAADLPLYRFAFPQLASFEMISSGIRPIPVEPDDVHRCIFHAIGIWMKGRAGSWYTSATRKLARQAYRIFSDHKDVFRSRQCDPMIPTLQPDLYANRFAKGGRIIVTVYNAGYATITGDLVQMRVPGDWSVASLLPKGPAGATHNAGKTTIRGTVEPRSTAVILLSAPGRSATSASR